MTNTMLSSEELTRLLDRGFKQKSIDISPISHMRQLSLQPLCFFNVKKDLYIRELTQRNISHNKRQTKEELRNLLLANDASYYRIMCGESTAVIPELIMALPSETSRARLLSIFNDNASKYGLTKRFTTITYQGRLMTSTQTLGELINAPGTIASLKFD